LSVDEKLVKIEAHIEALRSVAMLRAAHIGSIDTVLQQQQDLTNILDDLREWVATEVGKCLVEVASADNANDRYQRSAGLLLSIQNHIITMHAQAAAGVANISGRKQQQEQNVAGLQQQADNLASQLDTLQRIDENKEEVFSERPRKIGSHPESVKDKKQYQELVDDDDAAGDDQDVE